MSNDLAVYREENGRGASLAAAATVLLVTVGAGYLIAQSIRIGNAGPIAVATTAQVDRSVRHVIDDRLAAERIRTLLGAPEQGVALNSLQTDLQKVLEQQLAAAKGGGSAFFTTVVSELGRDLERRIVPEIKIAQLNEIRRQARSEVVATQIERLEGAVNDQLALQSATFVKAWADAAAEDSALALSWTALQKPAVPAGATLASFLTDAVAPARLTGQIARRVAADLVVSREGTEDRGPALKDLAARFAWGTTAIIFVGLCGAAILVPIWQIWTLLPAGRAGRVLTVTIVAAIVTAFIVVQWPSVSAERIEYFGPILANHESELGTWVIPLSRALTAFAAAAIVVMFAGAWASVWEDDEALVETQLRSLRLIFNAGAAALVAGTLQLATLYAWVVAVVGASPDGTAVGSAAMIAAGYPAALFSVALLAIYVPPLAVLRGKVRSADDPATHAQLADQGLSDSPRQKFLVLLQALAPLLAAIPMTGLLSILGG